MTDQELKKLRRSDLLELLIAQGKENEQLRARLAQAEAQLAERKVLLTKAGSIAEASLQLNGVFEAAQAAAEQYLENVRRLSGQQEQVCARLESESRQTAERRLSEAEEACRRMEEETQRKCREMLESAEKESKSYWEEAQHRLESFCAAHEELHDFFAGRKEKGPEE